MLADVTFEDSDVGPVARVRGEIDISNVGDVTIALQRAVDQASAGMVVDFSNTDYLDSAGLHFVFDLAKRLRDRGQRLCLVAPDGSPVAAVLEIVNVGTLAPRCQTVEDALARLRAHAADVPQK